MKARFVVFEGADACGKGTQSRLLTDALNASGVKAIRVEPTKESSKWAREKIYGWLANGKAKDNPLLFQFIQLFNRLYFQLFCLPKLLRSCQVVVADRWALSGWVYGGAERIKPWINDLMYSLARKADLTVVLGGWTYRRREANDSYEDDLSLQIKVKTAYYKACQARANHAFVDNGDPIMDVHASIMALLQNKGIVRL